MALDFDYTETITKEEVPLPTSDKDKLAFLLHNVLSKKECENLIKESEKKGYELAMVNVGLGRMRFLRYDPGEYFKPHLDGSYVRENGEKSLITFQLYLNEGFKGGSTTFINPPSEIFPVIPRTGSVLIFQHNICHEGSVLKKGRKYTMRTDIMYGSFNIELSAGSS